VVEEPLDVGAQPRQTGRLLPRGLDHQLLEDRARRIDRGQLQLLLGAEVREQPALAHADRIGQARERQTIEPFNGRQARRLVQDRGTAALAVGPRSARRPGGGALVRRRGHGCLTS
jgi:hypothetical protein